MSVSTANPPAALNPFSLVYSALWDLATRSPAVAALVREGNRIRFDDESNRGPLKGTIAPADTPELALMVRSLSANLRATSSTSSCVRQYAWMVSTNDLRYTQLLSPLEWALFCAMDGWPTALGALRWADKAFVKRVQLSGGSTGLSDAEQNRGIRGWSAVWSVDVEMHFEESDLAAYAAAERGD